MSDKLLNEAREMDEALASWACGTGPMPIGFPTVEALVRRALQSVADRSDGDRIRTLASCPPVGGYKIAGHWAWTRTGVGPWEQPRSGVTYDDARREVVILGEYAPGLPPESFPSTCLCHVRRVGDLWRAGGFMFDSIAHACSHVDSVARAEGWDLPSDVRPPWAPGELNPNEQEFGSRCAECGAQVEATTGCHYHPHAGVTS